MATTLEKELRELVFALVLFLAGLGYAVSGLPANIVVGCVIWGFAWMLVTHLFFVSEYTELCPRDVKVIFWGAVTFLVVLALLRPVQKEYAKENAPPLPIPQPEKREPPPIMQPSPAPRVRSYLILDGPPRYQKADPKTMQPTANQDFEVGDQLLFNVYFEVKGPNPIEIVQSVFHTYLESDPSRETQKRIVADFRERIRKGPTWHETLAAGEPSFNTAFAESGTGQYRILSQADLDAMRTGTEVAIVLVQITYKDNNVTHHLRSCELLQAPAIPSHAIWARCWEFVKSD